MSASLRLCDCYAPIDRAKTVKKKDVKRMQQQVTSRAQHHIACAEFIIHVDESSSHIPSHHITSHHITTQHITTQHSLAVVAACAEKNGSQASLQKEKGMNLKK